MKRPPAAARVRAVTSVQSEQPIASPEHEAPGVERAETRELRLAVVLYGGVSLAIYMHGTTKELHRLVKASALQERGGGPVGSPSERVYRELLRDLAQRDPHGVRTRVVVDVVSGTSAGGINGVYLAKAIAHNRSQDALRDLWLNRGDIKQLLRGPGWLPRVIKVPWLLATAVRKPPLKGDAMSRWIYGALQDMDRSGPDPADVETLMPPRHPLELFVTTTDFYGYDRDLVISDPQLIHDHAHRHVLRFGYGDGDDDFTAAENGALAFSARATSCFPGAFPPVDFATFRGYLAEDGADLSTLGSRFFRIYELSNAQPETTSFVDGGVLDNRPFGHAIRAIKKRAAETEVKRRLLYLEPDPGARGKPPPGKSPSPLATVLGSISGIPRKEPILDDIQDVSRHNERVRRIRDVIEMTFAPIAARVEEIVGDLASLSGTPSAEQLAGWRTRINEEAQQASGFAYATYIRSKVGGVVDRYARTICRLSNFPEDCNQAAFVRATLRSWAEGRLFTQEGERPVAVDDQVDFLRTFDLEYGARRLRFVIDGLSWLYEHAGKPGFPTRAQLNEGKRTLYEVRDVLLDAMEGEGVGTDLTAEVLACFAQEPIDRWVYEENQGPDEYADAHVQEFTHLEEEFGKALNARLAGLSETLYERVREISDSLPPRWRKDLLVRYLGFPFWDSVLYPIQALSDAGERDAIQVVRMSPKDTELLPPLPADKPKLSGMGIMHFGAFFDRAGRERDYLWGRLDGAERLIGILLGPDREEERAEWCRKAFAAIVAEEEEALPEAGDLLERARTFSAA